MKVNISETPEAEQSEQSNQDKCSVFLSVIDLVEDLS